MTFLEITKGILSPSDSTKPQLLHSVKEGNQWDQKKLHKTTEASSLSLQDCQILPSAGLYWIKYSLSLLWPPAKSNSLCWALGRKYTRTRILRDILESYIHEVCSGLRSYHPTWDLREDFCENTGLCTDLEFGLPKVALLVPLLSDTKLLCIQSCPLLPELTVTSLFTTFFKSSFTLACLRTENFILRCKSMFLRTLKSTWHSVLMDWCFTSKHLVPVQFRIRGINECKALT